MHKMIFKRSQSIKMVIIIWYPLKSALIQMTKMYINLIGFSSSNNNIICQLIIYIPFVIDNLWSRLIIMKLINNSFLPFFHLIIVTVSHWILWMLKIKKYWFFIHMDILPFNLINKYLEFINISTQFLIQECLIDQTLQFNFLINFIKSL